MYRIKRISFFIFFFALSMLFVLSDAYATVYFYYDAEDGTIGQELPHQIAAGEEFCQPECGSSNPNRGRISNSIIAPQGTKFFEWHCPDSTHDAWNIVKDKGKFPVQLKLGTTYYLAYFMRFDALSSKQIWANGQGEKGIEIRGSGLRWVTSRGRNLAYHNIPDSKFTVYLGNPSYHLNSGNEVNDVFLQNMNGYSATNPYLLSYGKWYALVFRFDITNTKSGTIALFIDGTEILRYNNIQLINSSTPELSSLELGGTIAQPNYDAGDHYRRFDGLIVSDNWQDIVNGGYLSSSGGGGASSGNQLPVPTITGISIQPIQ